MNSAGTNRRGRLIVVAGLPGRGKTTLATEIAARSTAVRAWMRARTLLVGEVLATVRGESAPDRAWCSIEPDVGQVGEESDDGAALHAGRPQHGVADPVNGGLPSALERLIGHTIVHERIGPTPVRSAVIRGCSRRGRP